MARAVLGDPADEISWVFQFELAGRTLECEVYAVSRPVAERMAWQWANQLGALRPDREVKFLQWGRKR